MGGPLLLVIIDGFGLAAAGRGNAISLARTPVFDDLFARRPFTPLSASGLDVGLPAGVMGNSEVGHLNIGAGRVVPQDVVRIDESIASGSLFDNEVLRAAASGARRRGARLHLMGLYSDGNVHASDRHVHALVELAVREGLQPESVLVHPFTDGRDTAPRSAERFLAELARQCAGRATVATVTGRYYAMDRDRRWERTAEAYRAIVGGEGRAAADASAALREAYARGESDEFVRPTVLDAVRGRGPLVRAGDAVIFWNFRADRARQLCAALVDPEFDGFEREPFPRGVELASMTLYDERQSFPPAFPPQRIEDTLGQVWSRRDLRQLRIAETEKYAHVTYFFNGGEEAELPGERRLLVPSPKVATYDLAPEMSARELTDALLAELEADRFDAAVLNFANPDMVGHTGNIEATVTAVETVDRCVGRLVGAVLDRAGLVAITADHGNAEQMLDPVTGGPHTAHTTNPVPLILCGAPQGTRLRGGGRLCDVAPTLLELTGVEPPAAMTGRSLCLR